MESIIPLNGRVAIVDDDEKQAMPLMRVLSRNNIPYTFYKGNDYRFLPKTPENDIRILFLDLNLLGNTEENTKDIRSVLIPTLSRILSPHNYPYILILWSRQESLYLKTLEDVFKNELKDCSPIAIKNYVKSDFFHDYGTEEDDTQDDSLIIDELKMILAELPAYSYLMQWENCVHNSADKTIQEIFHDFHSLENWDNSANCILDMFCKSYLGKHYNDASIEDKAKASLLFLNDVYCDTLESHVNACNFPEENDLSYSVNEEYKKEMEAKINEFLLISNQTESIHQPGCMIDFGCDFDDITYFFKLIDNCLHNLPKKFKMEDVYQNLIPCAIVVTPACDYAQNKNINDRIVQGVIIDSDFQKYIDKSEAIFISPIFTYESHHKIIVLNFRYFITTNLEGIKPKRLLRLRSSILAEIQSKLARHINRQGIMNL